MARLAYITLLAMTCLSCAVSDEIDFQMKQNHPPLLITTEPSNDSMQYATDTTTTDFTVTVWDPDEDDLEFYDARISLMEHVNSSVQIVDTYSCDAPVTGEMEEYDTGVVVSITCTLNLEISNATSQNVIVEVELSDRGYKGGGKVPDNANTLVVSWFYEIIAKDTLQEK